MAKLALTTLITLMLTVTGCATFTDSQKISPTSSKHCEATNEYAEVSTKKLQLSLQNSEETRGTTAKYKIDSCKLLASETKALSLVTIELNKNEMIIGEMGLVVFLAQNDQGDWDVVNFGILYAESYQNNNNNNDDKRSRGVTHL